MRKTSIEFLPKNIRGFELHPKVAEMLDYILENAAKEFEDIEYKYRNPELVSDDVIERVIYEYGFQYINDLADTLIEVDRSILLYFMGLLYFYKGTRIGLELILRVLGFGFEIQEWWEQDPKGEHHTFNMTVLMDTSNLKGNVFETIDKIKEFSRFYVYPLFDIANVSFLFDIAEVSITHAGFRDNQLSGLIEATI